MHADEHASLSTHNIPPGLDREISQAWQTIAPFWSLKNLIACNPLQGMEHLPIEQGLREGEAYFQQEALPEAMESVNAETIKWLQCYFDEGQAAIGMPGREQGLYAAFRRLAPRDTRLTGRKKASINWLHNLPEEPQQVISESMLALGVPANEHARFLTLLLTTLPGWAGYVKYRTEWMQGETGHPLPVTQAGYLAVRLIITRLLWSQAAQLLGWHETARERAASDDSRAAAMLQEMEATEAAYRPGLLHSLREQATQLPDERSARPDVQLVFCIDVRSEPMRRAIEARGNYETLGFAGFFGVPVRIEDEVEETAYVACPALLTPAHTVTRQPDCDASGCAGDTRAKARISGARRLYQSLKYNYLTPFGLAETLGPWNGLWMGLRTLLPRQAMALKARARQAIRPDLPSKVSLDSGAEGIGISIDEQCQYAEGALRLMGLTSGFAPLVMLCGHGSTTQNNAYATALDCGACAGRHGGHNARILAAMLNHPTVRARLDERGITIPEDTVFAAGAHNTTTDAITLYDEDALTRHVGEDRLVTLKDDLADARETNARWRAAEMGYDGANAKAIAFIHKRAQDWSETRPEWGLARNAAFIIGPRSLSQSVDLQGRSFLHSYDWQQDANGSALTTILTAPMVVTQWINNQYLFSTLDPVAYGGGSKITQNVTAKIGVMQGNASDLMTGLPLQSLYASDNARYHEPARLLSIVYAPRERISRIINEQEVLQRLLGNGWVSLACIDPTDGGAYMLTRVLGWEAA